VLVLVELVAGGHAVGTVVLVEEDQNTKYSELLLKYFLAEGIAQENGICVVSADDNPVKLLECKRERERKSPIQSVAMD
jgi:elongator complex protein 4